jgi:hypothetical protein
VDRLLHGSGISGAAQRVAPRPDRRTRRPLRLGVASISSVELRNLTQPVELCDTRLRPNSAGGTD